MREKQKKIKGSHGITLIALVVTIVVLLILAGVSISMLTGENGIISQAQESKYKTIEANAKEQIGVEVVGSYGVDGDIDIDLLNKNLQNIKGIKYNGAELTDSNKISSLPATVELDGVKVVINGDGSTSEPIAGKTYDTETDITIGETTITVPGGATISGIEGEYENSNEGIVIYIIPEDEKETVDWDADEDNDDRLDVQEKYDQFVWVPVPNPVAASDAELATMMSEEKYPIAVAIDGTDANGLQNYRGALYDFALSSDETKVNITAKAWSADSTSNREPAYLTDSSSTDASSYNTVGITEDLLQQEYNKMVDRVKTNKGFWVGRYETSNMVGTATTNRGSVLNEATVEADTTNRVTVIKGTTTGISYDETIPNFINWYRMYAQQKNYSKLALGSATKTTSSMIWGSQWDQIMIWMKGVQNTVRKSFYIVNSVGMGNYGTISGVDDGYSDTSVPAETGCFGVKNVYDLAGNVLDWTLEATVTKVRVLRSGEFSDTDSAFTRADTRALNYPYNSASHFGSRCTLY